MAKVTQTSSVTVGRKTYKVKRVDSLASVLPQATVEATTVQLRVLAEEARELLLDRLYAANPQPPGKSVVRRPRRLRRTDIPTIRRKAVKHPALAEKTVKKKAAKETDGRKLIETGEYINGVEVFKGKQRGATYYTVRPKPGIHKGSKMTHIELARVHEFGSAAKKIPPRPHWGPATRDVIAVAKKMGKTVQAEALRRAVRRL